MTRPLRRAHLTLWLALAWLLPLALIVGLAARKSPQPINPNLHWEKLK